MTQYAIYDGGNTLQHYDSFVSGAVGYDNIRPTNHQPNRNRTILFHVNTGGYPFTADWNPLRVENNDEMLTHLIGAGWVIKSVGVHVRQAGLGVLNLSIQTDDADIPLVDYMASAAPAPVEPSEPESPEVPRGTSLAIDLSTTGFKYLKPMADGSSAPHEFLNESGLAYIKCKVTGLEAEEIMAGCFGVLLELMYLEDDGECNCITVPCPTEFPVPECAPNI